MVPPKSERPITKRGINFYDEDITRLQTFFPPRKINHVVRELVHRWLKVIEDRAQQKSGAPTGALDIDLESLDPADIEREVDRNEADEPRPRRSVSAERSERS